MVGMEKKTKPKMERFTFKHFEEMFPDDAACLEWLRNFIYPEGIYCKLCKKVTMHHRVASRPSYSCDYCGHHVHPTAGTIFHKSPTSLKTWFHAIYLMASTRCGISAKQIERETGVTYKTAWRMFNKIRTLLQDDFGPLSGSIEMDETYIRGKRKGGTGRPMRGDKTKTPGSWDRRTEGTREGLHAGGGQRSQFAQHSKRAHPAGIDRLHR